MKKLPLLLLPALLFLSCRKEINNTGFSNALLTSLKFEAVKNPKLKADVVADVQDGKISVALPLGVSRDSLVATFTTSDAVSSVRLNGAAEISGTSRTNYAADNTLTVYDNNRSSRQYSLSVCVFTGLPIVYLTTTDGAAIDSKDNYVSGKIRIDSNYTTFASLPLSDMQIKLRGNSTAFLPKHPYKIKLAAKAPVLGMPSDKEWVLLANYNDKTLLRNYLAFEASKAFEMDYTPRSQFVEVFLNGQYLGNYQLTEQVKIATSRINIKEMDQTDVSASKITGGYFLEIDTRLDEENWFITNRDVPITLKSPDFGVPAQNDYIHGYVQQMEDALFSDNFTNASTGYAKYLNPTTAIKWFWVNELMKNIDAKFNSSIYLYKDRGGILNFGPVWDFDVAGGNNFQSGTDKPEGWYVKDGLWFVQLFKDPAFADKAIALWKTEREKLYALLSTVDNEAALLKYSQNLNFKTWDLLNTYVWPNAAVLGSYNGEVTYFKSWLQKRMAWIDANLETLRN